MNKMKKLCNRRKADPNFLPIFLEVYEEMFFCLQPIPQKGGERL